MDKNTVVIFANWHAYYLSVLSVHLPSGVTLTYSHYRRIFSYSRVASILAPDVRFYWSSSNKRRVYNMRLFFRDKT